MKALTINIVGLSLKVHHFEFSIDNGFWKAFDSDFIKGGEFSVHVTLDKHETFIEADFSIEGNASLICDRSLEEFAHPIRLQKRILFKYGEVDEELSDEIVMISRERVNLDIGQFVFEFIGLAIPIKKLHPRFQEDENEELEGKLVYSSSTKQEEEEGTNPVWEKLKKLK